MIANNTPKYSVKQAAQLTGLSVNQIRLWERRYELVQPSRADNGYRFYTDEDLNILRFVLKERKKGNSMQVIMSLTRSEMLHDFFKEKEISEVVHSDQLDIQRFIRALKKGQAHQFENYLIESQAGLSFLDAIKQNDLNILREIGQLEHAGKLPMPCSHIASSVIRKRILAHVQNMGMHQGEHPVVLASAPDDYHEIGLLASLLELVQLHTPVMYLGANVPIDELIDFSTSIQPRAIIISISNVYTSKNLNHLLKHYQELVSKFKTAFGGYEVTRQQSKFHAKGLTTLNHTYEIVDFLGLH